MTAATRPAVLFTAALALVLGFGPLAPALAGTPDDYLDAGAAALTAGDYDTAIDQLSKALNTRKLAYKDRPKAYHWRGRAYESKGFWGLAEADYGRAVWLNSKNELYNRDLNRMRRRMSSGGP